MTKLMEWLAVFTAFLAIWVGVYYNVVEISYFQQNPCVLCMIPIIAIVTFGVYAVTVVLYRTFTFNSCDEAAKELLKEIDEAKEDLIKKGFKYRN